MKRAVSKTFSSVAAKRPRPPPEVVAARRAERKAAKQLAKSIDPLTGFYKVNKRAEDNQRFSMRAKYNGELFHGWQKLHKDNAVGLRTVESVLEMSLRPYLYQKVRFIPSGRTDAKVSARNQMIQFDVSATRLANILNKTKPESSISNASSFTSSSSTISTTKSNLQSILPIDVEQRLQEAFNTHLPADIRILQINRVSSSFNVMLPKWKRYHYMFPSDLSILAKLMRHADPASKNDNKDPPPLLQPPSLQAMRNAAAVLIGTHDFGSYQSSHGRKTTTRTVHACDINIDQKTGGYVLSIASNGFLMHMVRIVAGTLLEVGCGLRSMEDMNASLVEIRRKNAGVKLPGSCLTLDWVEYDTRHPSFID